MESGGFVKRFEPPTYELGPEIKRQIFENFLERIKKLGIDGNRRSTGESCPELNPDVIVISSDQTVIFEAQNERASKLLRRRCGWDTETITLRERIRVHPSQSQKVIGALLAAGLKVACWNNF
jgi:hypothetical protein